VRPFLSARGGAFVAACALGLALAGDALADTPKASEARGAPSLDLARKAWAEGEFAKAESMYREALSRGGFEPKETLECWVYLGVTRAVLGKRDLAVSAFRQAAFIDPHFQIPSEGGKKAVHLATEVRTQQVGFGQLLPKLEAPFEVPPGAAFTVRVTMDPAHTALVTRLGLVVKDGTTGKSFQFEHEPEESVKFTVPQSMAVPGSRLVVRVDALDASDNKLATTEARVGVKGAAAGAPIASASPSEKDGATKKGFWSSPWPWVVGGAVIVAAGATAIGVAAMPPNQVDVGAARIRPGG
jgi:hypothetical protein